MPHPYSNYTKDPAWDDEKKIDSREQGIILSYHESFGRDSIPADKQYWTMCGAYFNETTKEKLHGELGQLTDVGLIQKRQFHGVDREEVTIKKNLEAYPDINWHHGDFKEVMGQSAYENRFNPAIINYDGVMQPEFGAKYLKSIMKFVDHNVKDELMLVANFVLRNPYRGAVRFEGGDVLEELKTIYLFPDHWTLKPQFYGYNGAGKRSHTRMGMFVFLKSKHESIAYTKGKLLTGVVNEQ